MGNIERTIPRSNINKDLTNLIHTFACMWQISHKGRNNIEKEIIHTLISKTKQKLILYALREILCDDSN